MTTARRSDLIEIPLLDLPALSRALLPYAIGAVVLAALAGLAWWFELPRKTGAALASLSADAGFNVTGIDSWGMSNLERADLETALAGVRGQPILAIDLDALRGQLQQVTWVKDAVVARQLPDRLTITITERKPFALWQHNRRLSLIDRDGMILATSGLERFARLPLVVGNGAPTNAAPLFDALARAPRLASQLDSVVWIGNRRWDLRFKSGETLMLPEGQAPMVAALQYFASLDAADGLLGKGFERFDLRLGDRMFIQKRPAERAGGVATQTKGATAI
jgi:cell division protein FtsQ